MIGLRQIGQFPRRAWRWMLAPVPRLELWQYLLIALLSVGAGFGIAQQGAYPQPAGGGTNQGPVYVVNTSAGGSCGSNSNCYAVTGNMRSTADGGTTNTNKTVTSATANFTAADINRTIYVVNPANGAVVQNGTIQTINSATSVQSSANSTATLSANGVLAIGTDDAPNFKAAYQAAVALGQGLSVPCGAFLLNSDPPVFVDSAPEARAAYSIAGCAPGGNNNNALFVLGPALLNSTGVIFASMPSTGAGFPYFAIGGSPSVSNVRLSGLGAVGTGAFQVINSPIATLIQAYDIKSSGGCTLLTWTSGEAHFDDINIQTDPVAQGYGGDCVSVNMSGQGSLSLKDSIIAFKGNLGIDCVASTPGTCELENDYVINSGGAGQAAVQISGIANIRGGLYEGNGANPLFGVGGTLNIIGASINGFSVSNTVPIFNIEGGVTVHSRDTTYATYNGADFFSNTNGIFANEGGNSFSALPTTTLPKLMATPTESGTGTCASNAATITYTGTYLAAPTVVVTDYVSTDTAGLNGAPGTTTATVHCSGASDAFGYTVTPNYF